MSKHIHHNSRRNMRFLLLSLLLCLMLAMGCVSGSQDTGGKTTDETWQTAEETWQTTAVWTDELTEAPAETIQENADISVEEDGWYSTKDEVALYLQLYGHLPGNYITKNEARNLGWDSSLGNLWDVAEGMSIGGDKFGNYEGLLPDAPGRQWRECDIGYEGGYRGAERILYSNDGLIYYTDDHYETFTCIYGEE